MPKPPPNDELDKLLKKVAGIYFSNPSDDPVEMFVIPKLRAALSAYVDRQVVLGRIEELEKLWPDFTVDGYFSVDGEKIKDRLATLQNQLKELE